MGSWLILVHENVQFKFEKKMKYLITRYDFYESIVDSEFVKHHDEPG